MKRMILILALATTAVALDSFGAIRPEPPGLPEANSGHEVNNLYLVFNRAMIDDARWPGREGTDLLYQGCFGFGPPGDFIYPLYFSYDTGWVEETIYYHDLSWPTEVPWGDVPPRYGDENLLVYMTVEGEEPLGLKLRQHSFGFADGKNEDAIFILWTVFNAEAGYLKEAAAGLFMDMDLGEHLREFPLYDHVRQFAYMQNEPSIGEPLFFGLTTMGELPASFHGWTLYDGEFDRDAELHYAMLSQEGRFQELPENFYYDWRLLLGFPLRDLPPGEMQDYALVLAAGDSLEAMLANVRAARVKWLELFGDGPPEPSAPPRLALSEPWPCPAGSEARLFVELVEGGRVEAALYDLSGRRVATVYDGFLAAGRSELLVRTGGLPPGVYLVQAAVEGVSATRRLVVAR